MGGRSRRHPRQRGRSTATPTSPAAEAPAAVDTSTAAVDAQALESEVLGAIRSLYDCELKPYGRIIRKRLAELREEAAGIAQAGGSAEEGDGVPVLSPAAGQDLRSFCENCEQLVVELEEGGEWSALLRDRAPHFVDIYCNEDKYPPEMWAAAAEYFEAFSTTGDGSSEDLTKQAALPGGRYASARALVARKPEFLQGYSLGQVCHIINLAVSQRKLLGYFNGAIVPYKLSTSMVKSRFAEQQRACSSADPDAENQAQVASWSDARDCLGKIMQEAFDKGAQRVPLSNVKRLFRSRFQMELSETALGHSKISALLQDHRFEDICSVELQERGYAVVPPRQRVAPQQAGGDVSPSALQPRINSDLCLLAGSAPGEDEACSMVPTPTTPSSPVSSESDSPATKRKRKPPPPPLDAGCLWPTLLPTTRTFIHAPVPPPTPMGPGAAHRSHSVPSHMCLGQPPASPKGLCASPLGLCRAAHAAAGPPADAGRPRCDTAPACVDERRVAFYGAADPEQAKGHGFGECLTLEGLEEVLEAPEEVQAADYPARTPSPQWGGHRWSVAAARHQWPATPEPPDAAASRIGGGTFPAPQTVSLSNLLNLFSPNCSS